MSIELTEMPYSIDALEPRVSAKTLEFHHGKHHKAYVGKLNAEIIGTAYEGKSLKKIIAGAREQKIAGIFNNAAQAWNHTFLWHSMPPNGGGEPVGPSANPIAAQFGNLREFQAVFKNAALGQFGSRWTWLVQTADGIDVVSTGNADTSLIHGFTPLLTLDVWEHAYYLDDQNRRDAYIDAYLGKSINSEFAPQNCEHDRAAA